MISRKSAKLIAQAYKVAYSYYSGTKPRYFHFERDELHDFLYEEDYEAWFLNQIKKMKDMFRERELQEFFMRLHTGESVVANNWSWDDRRKLGQRYLRDLAEDLLNVCRSPTRYDRWDKEYVKETVKTLKSQLELDGYIYKDGMLFYSESSVINEVQEQSYLAHLVDNVALADKDTITHHIKLAEEHYVNGKWGDSISNSRNFLEAVLQQVAAAVNKKKYAADLPLSTYERPFAVRDYLEREHLIETKEKEAIAKVYGLLSDTGSHPNIAEKDQARLMWHLALTFSQFVLLRYQGFLANNP
jgi:hypothetical protein